MIGCISNNTQEIWPKPIRPNLKPIQVTKSGDGYFLSQNSASNLVQNIDEMKYYILKMELLLNKMSKTYNIKYEEYKSSEK